MTTQLTLNIVDYLKWKTEGTVTLQKIGGNSIFMVKDRWDPESGAPIDSAFASISIPVCTEEIAKLQTAIDNATALMQSWNDLKTDVEALLTE